MTPTEALAGSPLRVAQWTTGTQARVGAILEQGLLHRGLGARQPAREEVLRKRRQRRARQHDEPDEPVEVDPQVTGSIGAASLFTARNVDKRAS